MSFIKRAWLYLVRNKIKTILLFLVLLIVGIVIAGAITIQNGISGVERTIRQKTAVVLTILLDEEAIAQKKLADDSFRLEHFLTPNLIEKIAQSEEVKSFDYTVFPLLVGSDHIQRWIDTSTEYSSQTTNFWDFHLVGIHRTPMMLLESGKAVLKQGRSFEAQDMTDDSPVTIISQDLAVINHISVGDWLILKNYILDWSEAKTSRTPKEITSLEIPLQVIGIIEFADQSSLPEGLALKERLDRSNTLWVPNKLLMAERIRKNLSELSYGKTQLINPSAVNEKYQVYYLMNEDSDIERFISEANQYLPEYYKLVTNMDSYDVIAAPLEQASQLADYVLKATIIASVFVISLVMVLILRDRKYEMAVLLSLGEHRGKIIGQLITEIMLVSLVTMLLSFAIGQMMAGWLSDTLVRNQLIADISQESVREMFDNQSLFGTYTSGITPGSLAEAYMVAPSLQATVLACLLILGTCLAGTIIPALYLFRLSPRHILQ